MRMILLALLAILVAVPAKPPLQACAIAPQSGGSVGIASESALILFDAKAKVQHFVRTANFDTSSSEFGFFVPTPTRPELAEATGEVFAALAKLTAPRVIEKTVHETVMPNIGCFLGMSANKTFSHVGASMDRSPVQVVETKRVGDFDAVVLQATNAAKLQEWLNENKYATRPALEQWFDVYIQKGWYLVAFKIAAEASGKTANRAVRISFPTEVPIYPYREPSDAAGFAGKSGSRSLRLFVVADRRVAGRIGESDWQAGKPVWAKPVEEATLAPILAAGKVPALAGTQWITEFEDRSSPRVGFDDLYFPAAKEQTELERPPHINITYVYWYWLVIVFWIGLALLSIFALDRVIRMFRRK